MSQKSAYANIKAQLEDLTQQRDDLSMQLAGTNRNFEFQRMHGMGEALYDLYEDVIRPSRAGAAE